MSELKGAVQGDPLACLVRDGVLPRGVDAAYDDLAACVRFAGDACPELTVLGVSTLPMHEGGAHAVDELGYLLSAIVETLRKLAARGLDVGPVCGQIEVTLGVGGDLFVELAKLRAARRLWGKLLAASGVQPVAMRLHVRSADATFTRRDPWVNMLRAIQAGFVGAVGGADVITLLPFDAALGESDVAARRTARNLHLLLAEEGHLSQVTDPSAGSYYIEQLTDQLARGAWGRFQGIEAAGGLLQALSDDVVQGPAREAACERARDLATRRQGVVGVSRYALAGEPAVTRPTFDPKAFMRLARTRWEAAAMAQRPPQHIAALNVALDALNSGTLDRVEAAANAVSLGATLSDVAGRIQGVPFTVVPVAPTRNAAAWEALRDLGGAHPPPIFLANLGSIPEHKARESFARDLFTAGGFDVRTNEGFDSIGDAIAAFEASGSALVCICGNDAAYAQVPDLAAALRAAGATCVIVAGKRPDEPVWVDVDQVVHLGADVLSTMKAAHDSLGGAR